MLIFDGDNQFLSDIDVYPGKAAAALLGESYK
jgi:hypothetical protein